jgi:hypothetical protein
MGQANRFRRYTKERIPYAVERYINEANRTYSTNGSESPVTSPARSKVKIESPAE